jgi:hypothetical protein
MQKIMQIVLVAAFGVLTISPPAAASDSRPRIPADQTDASGTARSIRKCICTAQYDPVCARKLDGRLETFSNPCRARCEGAAIVRKGLCR